jgi:hypothetical protein
MHWLNDYYQDGDRAIFRPFGHASPAELADLTTMALERAYTHGCREALINIIRMYGFETPGPAYRRWLVRRWARTVLSEIDIAVVCRKEHISMQNEGLITAMQEGLRAHVCTSEDEALAWLDAFSAVHH